MYFIDIYFKILASFFAKIEERHGEEKVDYYYKHFNILDTVKLLRPHVLDESLFDDIKEEFSTSDKVLGLLNVE